MTRLLHAPTLAPAGRRLDAPAPVLDQATRDLLARTEADAYARGRADGVAEARAAADQAGQQVMAAIVAAVDDVRRDLHHDAAARAAEAAELGRRMAEEILGRELAEGGAALVERLRSAVGALDHGPFTVHVAPVDGQVLADHAQVLPADTTIAVDPHLTPGEARITGPWSGADVTVQAMLDVLMERTP